MTADWQQKLEQVQQIEITDNLVEEVYDYVNQEAPDPGDFHATYRVLFRGSEKSTRLRCLVGIRYQLA